MMKMCKYVYQLQLLVYFYYILLHILHKIVIMKKDALLYLQFAVTVYASVNVSASTQSIVHVQMVSLNYTAVKKKLLLLI